MTYLWQLERGSNTYRIQTDEKEIADKLKRRQGFRISAISLNSPLWIFSCEFNRPDIAKKVISNLTGVKCKIDSEGVISYYRSNISTPSKIVAPEQRNALKPTLFGMVL